MEENDVTGSGETKEECEIPSKTTSGQIEDLHSSKQWFSEFALQAKSHHAID